MQKQTRLSCNENNVVFQSQMKIENVLEDTAGTAEQKKKNKSREAHVATGKEAVLPLAVSRSRFAFAYARSSCCLQRGT